MKKIINIISSFLIGVLVLSSCTPDKYSLGSTDIKSSDLVEGIAFTITHDADNQNIVYLTSLLDDPQHPISWIHPQGASRDKVVELRIAFEGTYDVLFGVQTPAGLVYGDTVQFTINQFYPDFVSDEMWTNLTGGVGNSKTWIFDNGKYGLANGEMVYADPSKVVEFDNYELGWDPGAGYTNDDNIWSSYMTFTLNNGAHIETHNEGWKDESGTFLFDTDTKILNLTGADLIHPEGWDNQTPNWRRDLKILALTEERLMVGIMRDPNTSGESEWWVIWNYVSKEYADNYDPGEQEDPVPDIGGDPNDILTTTKTKVWYLSVETPYDWSDLNGNLIYNFNSSSEYASNGFVYNESLIDGFSISLTTTGKQEGTYIITEANGIEYEGTYTVDEKNDIKFDRSYSLPISGNIDFSTTNQNKLRIVKVGKDAFGNIDHMWLGQRSETTDEYLVYHFELGASEVEVDLQKEFFKSICGSESRTYTIDVNWPVDWLGSTTSGSLTGGWTSAGAMEGWYWDDEIEANAKASRITFYQPTNSSCSVRIEDYTGIVETGVCTIDVDRMLVTITTGLPTIGNWLDAQAEQTEFYIVNSSFTDIKDGTFWLGHEEFKGDDGYEITAFHFIEVK